MSSFKEHLDKKRRKKRKIPNHSSSSVTQNDLLLETHISEDDHSEGTVLTGVKNFTDHNIHLFDGRGGGQVIKSQDFNLSCLHRSEQNGISHVDSSSNASKAQEESFLSNTNNPKFSSTCNAKDEKERHSELDDDAILTSGILPLVDELFVPNVATCSNFNMARSSAAAGDKQSSPSVRTFSKESITSSSRIIHYKQNDKWSCGFRNMQMILSALLPILQDCHPYFQKSEAVLSKPEANLPVDHHHHPSNKRRVPSLSQIQAFLEQSWADGFDPRGAKHYKNIIRGLKSQIGAVEVSSTLSYLQIDSVVAQFIHCHESRSLLGKFVWSYFTRKVGRDACFFCSCSKSSHDACHNDDDSESSFLMWSSVAQATELLRIAEVSHGNNNIEEDCYYCQCPLLPLYLQWEGHSVTIVGIKNATSPPGSSSDDSTATPQFSLLVFDPLKEGSILKEKISSTLSQRQLLCREENEKNSSSGCSMDSKIMMEKDEASIAAMYLPVSKLINEDCQIVMCSARPLSISERRKCRGRANAVTAASRAVGTVLQD
mmetsp:Transcript_24929/g.37179  ORF Transcript_24929/g.37179 Transcript_24929/m.37179 type:complete len:544 (-) Transcript_24929:188-1819(-)